MKKILLFLLISTTPAWPGSQAGLIYGTDSGALRRIIVPDDDKQLINPALIQQGESILVVDKSEIQTALDVMQGDKSIPAETAEIPFQILEKNTGKNAHPVLIAVVGADSKIESFIVADSKLDSLPGKDLIDTVGPTEIGQTYDKITKKFIPLPAKFNGAEDINTNGTQIK